MPTGKDEKDRVNSVFLVGDVGMVRERIAAHEKVYDLSLIDNVDRYCTYSSRSDG